MNNSTPLFNEIISKKAENNNGFLIVGCHGKGTPMIATKKQNLRRKKFNEGKEN